MLKTRLIPVLLLKNGQLVRSQAFSRHQYIGDPYHEVMRFNEWNVDELIYLDIGRSDDPQAFRQDTKLHAAGGALDLLPRIAKTCFVPLTFGGRVRTLEDFRIRLSLGADKIAVNTAAADDPEFITRAAETFGNQCVVVCIDARRRPDGSYGVFVDGGTRDTGRDAIAWAAEAAARGAGEILLQSVDRDGAANGYDLDLLRRATDATPAPVIALGGAGKYEDFGEAVLKTGVSAVAAANIFHFKELTDRLIKREMKRMGVRVREA